MVLELAAPEQVALGVPLARDLRRHGDRLAIVTPGESPLTDRELTYRELADRVDAVTRRLGTVRRLVLVAASNEPDPLVACLAALAGGHPVLLAAGDDPGRVDALISAYDPDVVFRRSPRGWRLTERRAGTAHDLHPDLALLLSTSGSTGSPKLVRLSADNVQANAEAIATYLDIRDTDRAATSLPLHYCYGLSVAHSNLLRGAALLLTGDSVTEESFWSLARRHRLTSLHGVPYTFDLLDALGFERMDLPHLRYVTQAGGRLDPARVRRYALLGQERGWRFFVMYGQTEATARMAYLPPELAADHPDTIGVPIPGGRFELDEGELVYHGPNVMLGYAHGPADLALGRTVSALRTGDLARRAPDGLYRIVGRRSRFVKPFGLRIDLGQVETLLTEHGHPAVCTGDDRALVVAVPEGHDTGAVRDLVRDRFGLPGHAVRVRALAELPRLPNGKIDYPALRAAATAEPDRPGDSVRELFARVLGHADIDPDATFVELGGDSLTYVRTSVELQRVLGTLPGRWHTTPVRELDRLRTRHRPSRLVRPVETNVVLRAVAIVLVVGTHIGLFHLLGGAHLLLVLAGWTFARFGLARVGSGRVAARVLRGAARIAVPSMLWLGFRAFTEPDVGLANVLLVSNYMPFPVARGYWFVEVLVQVLLVLGLVLAIPAVRRLERAHGFGFALGALAVALALNVLLDGTGQVFDHAMSAHGACWFFVLGWLAQRAATPRRKWFVAALGLLLVSGYFGNPVRDAVVVGGLALLLAVPSLPLPAPVVRLAGLLAGASLAIYLTHYAIYPALLAHLPALPVVLASLAGGVAAQALAQRAARLLRTRWAAAPWPRPRPIKEDACSRSDPACAPVR
ncbi:acyl-CoA synthetase (AMP-forming)/AMP-acid ligase II [Prauserella shujinwangii]|uniref:Acyl-CoA synthetase (AMP-forming)/AMP-acid ligase II n=1 Tax=Prauserella shujinwangii TaxID=1453103 RepID=A0A2T0LTU2_9PSEU|nr:AMP-binding protein [Prauserella shujinwangii]PRX47151.1 acyl-CoA synthetase (AMP-forming)/AMP-acid ligase II [Prauserella shujinwangii]